MKMFIAVAASLIVSACHQHERTQGVDEYVITCDQAASGAPFVSDEAYIAFANAEAAGQVKRDDARAPMLVEPQGTISMSTPPRFTLRVPMTASQVGCPSPGRVGWRARLASALVLERRAEAHCPAISGQAYLLRMTNAANAAEHVYTAVLSVTSYTPAAAVWQRALARRAGQTLAVAVLAATFSKGDITEGPFQAPQPVTLTVAP